MKRHSLLTLFILSLAASVFSQDACVVQQQRTIPVAYEVDVLVVGGSTEAVAAAAEASQAAAKTLLITDLPYLGDDMTATL